MKRSARLAPLPTALLILCLAMAPIQFGCTGPPATAPNQTTAGVTGKQSTQPSANSERLAASPPESSDAVTIPANQANSPAPAASETAVAAADTATPSSDADQPASSPKLDPLDWPYCRGQRFDGVSPETGLLDDWDPKGGADSNVAWKRDDLGGRSTPIVMRGRLYTIVRSEPGTPREGEKVVCVDAKTGETIWENRFNVYLSDVPDTRVGWSSCVGDPQTGRVYALGVCGHFQCLDGETGKTIWSYPLHERFGVLSTYGGRTNFPILCDDLVIVSAVVIGWGEMAKPAHRFLAFDKMTGETVWLNGTRLLPEDTTYSPPVLTVIDGQQALVAGSGDGALWALQPRTGQPIWQYRLSRRGLNLAPLAVGGRVLMGHSEENIVGTTMGTLLAIDPAGNGDITDKAQVWRNDELMIGHSAPLLVGQHVWAFDDRAKLHIFDAQTGEPIGRRIALGTMMRGSPLYADGKVYAITAGGRWYILQPDPEVGAKILKKGRLPEGEECNSSLICSHGRIYFTTSGGLYCLYDPSKQSDAGEASPLPEETPAAADDPPACVQVVPVDVLLEPGDKQKFSVRLFNSRGQFLKSTEATFQLEGPGEIGSDGVFVAPLDAQHTATIVTATVGDLAGIARIRIVPPLPWEFDFEDVVLDAERGVGQPPISWVGARYRHVIREIDGNKVMVKVTTIPKGTRSRCWFGPSDLHDYTIQADVRGAIQDDQMPDIGLIAQGYTLDLQGAHQKLQIRTWDSQLRMARTVEFPWEPDKWYTMKFRAANEGDKAVLRAKVWPKGEAEPAEWTLQATDEVPNTSGSPGLYGNAKDAEIFLDNIRVYSN